MTWMFRTKQDRQAFDDAIAEIHATPSDRAAAIVAGSFLENQLTAAIQKRLHAHEKIISDLFRASGPLGNFGTKIDLGFLLGLYGEKVHRELVTIKDIRNDFAHKLGTRTFDAQRIAALTSNLKMIEEIEVTVSKVIADEPREPVLKPFPRGGESDPISIRERYILSCQLYIWIFSVSPQQKPTNPEL